ncbi:MAG TPA: protein kinase [Urbifossiella sp.]|nr:protein kinase [Urbifossiella sp.]
MSAPSPLPRRPALPPEGASELLRLIDALDLLDRLMLLPAAGGASGDVPVGRFRAQSRVGAGRFGVVFLAEDPELRREVVVKVPQPAVLADPELRGRFVREARAAGRLDHPGVVSVYEAGEDRGLPYLAARYVPGPTLAGWLAARPSPPSPTVAARVVARLAAAVHHAHERGVLHCDLKPSNVLLGAGQASGGVHAVEVAPGEFVHPQVTDFGLARLLEDDPSQTRTFQVAGTPLYMAPEQAAGDRRTLTFRTDVYALGAILYELLTGRPPSAWGRDAAAPHDPARLRPGVPRDLAAVTLRCLETDPARRYASAADLVHDLGRFLAGAPVRARRANPGERLVRAARRHPAAAAAVVLAVALVGLLVRFAYARMEHAVEIREAERTAEVERFHARLAAVRERRTGPPSSGWAAENLADLRELATAAPAADHLADLRSEAVAALAAPDLRPVRVVEAGFAAYCASHSPDGAALAVGGWRAGSDGLGQVLVVDQAGGRRVLAFPLATGWDPEQDRSDGCRSVEYSPDGRWLLAGTRSGRLVRWDLRDTAAMPVVWAAHADDPVPPSRRAVSDLVFGGGGRTLYSSTSVTVRGWNAAGGWAAAGVWRGATAPSGVRAFPADPVFEFTLGAGEKRLARPGPDGAPVGPHGPAVFGDGFALAPGGRLAALTTGGSLELALVPFTPAPVPRPFVIPGRPRNVRFPVYDAEFSADVSVLATAGEHDRRVRLWDVAGGVLAADRVVGEGSGRLTFAPDGRSLGVVEGDRVVVYEVTGRVRESIGAGPWADLVGYAATPDGRTVTTFHRTEDHVTEVATWTEPGVRNSTRVVPKTLTDARLADAAPDGRAVAHVQVVGGAERVLTDTHGGVDSDRLTDLRFGPDGRLWATDARRVRVWTLPGWAEDRPLENDPAAVASGVVFRAVAPGRTTTLVGRRDGRVYRLPGGRTVHPFPAPVTALTLSGDETRAVVGGEGGEVVMLDLQGGTARPIPHAHRDAVRAVAFGPGGWLVTGSADGTAKFWAAGGMLLLTLHTGGDVRKLALSPDGTRLTMLIDGERAVRRWRLDLLRAELRALGLDWPH